MDARASVSTRLRRGRDRLLLWWRRARYQPHFTRCEPGFAPLGTLIIRNEGTLNAGHNLTIRSFRHQPVEITVGKDGTLSFGNDVFLNQGVRIGCRASVQIGDDCLIGDEVLILDSDWHGVGNRLTRTEPVLIEAHVWIAARATILRGVTLGEGCIVAAGAVVTHSVDAYTLVGGVPARPLRRLQSGDQST